MQYSVNKCILPSTPLILMMLRDVLCKSTFQTLAVCSNPTVALPVELQEYQFLIHHQNVLHGQNQSLAQQICNEEDC